MRRKFIFLKYRLFLVFLTLLLSVPLSIYAQDKTTFAWDYTTTDQDSLGANGGFRLYYGNTTGNYSGGILASATYSARQLTVSTSEFCGDKFFALTAFTNDSGTITESGYSNEVSAGYAPKGIGSLSYSPVGKFTWSLSTSEAKCSVLKYHLYASKVQGSYGAPDIIATMDAGVSTVSVDLSSYRGKWYFAVVPYTIGSDSREILSTIINEIVVTFQVAAPPNFRIVTGS